MAIVRFDPFRTARDFDRLANQVLNATSSVNHNSELAPAYDIEQHGDDTYMIHLSVPGAAEGDIEVTTHNGVLTVGANTPAAEKNQGVRSLHRGIARGKFERRFKLAEHVEVVEARLNSGILSLKLVREVPEALKPRTIAISSGTDGASANDSKPAIEAA